eukprot:9885409-Lingulodinium_polyedra.AAC.1
MAGRPGSLCTQPPPDPPRLPRRGWNLAGENNFACLVPFGCPWVLLEEINNASIFLLGCNSCGAT